MKLSHILFLIIIFNCSYSMASEDKKINNYYGYNPTNHYHTSSSSGVPNKLPKKEDDSLKTTTTALSGAAIVYGVSEVIKDNQITLSDAPALGLIGLSTLALFQVYNNTPSSTDIPSPKKEEKEAPKKEEKKGWFW